VKKRRIDVKTGAIGPKHDPYGCEAVIVNAENGNSAEYYTDGLGTVKVTCYSPDGFAVVEQREVDPETSVRAAMLVIFERHVGISPGSARDEFERTYEPDPFGNPRDFE